MAYWKHRIDLIKVINNMDDKYDLKDDDTDCPDEVKKAIVDELIKVPVVFDLYLPMVIDAVTVKDLNVVLDDIYDQADNERVWCGI